MNTPFNAPVPVRTGYLSSTPPLLQGARKLLGIGALAVGRALKSLRAAHRRRCEEDALDELSDAMRVDIGLLPRWPFGEDGRAARFRMICGAWGAQR